MADVIISRAEAEAQGLKRFRTGVPCRRGHLGERSVAHGRCLQCQAENLRKWAIENPERRREQLAKAAEKFKPKQAAGRRRWYLENRQVVLAKSKAYSAKNPHVARAATARWQAKNPGKAKSYAARWYADPENSAAHSQRRRSRKLSSGGTHTAADLKALLDAQHHCCTYCRTDLRKTKRHLDHIIPLSRGGSNGRTNLQWLCAPCNLAKGAKDPLLFAQEIGRLL